MRKFIVIRTQFEAIHSWPDCNVKGSEFLRHPHRHLFHVEIKCQVSHNERELEFFNLKRKIDKYLLYNLNGKTFLFSCETIAQTILEVFDADFVSVFEDNENGAEVYAD